MTYTDVTLPVDRDLYRESGEIEKKIFSGHFGTHFDVMDKEFPLEYCERKGYVFDVRDKEEISEEDIDLDKVQEGTLIAFCSGIQKKYPYGTKEYHRSHPQLSQELIEKLLKKKISLIGIDFAGIRRSGEHTPADQHCADHGVFVIENLTNLESVLERECIFYVFPLSLLHSSGLPCRVIVKTEKLNYNID